MPELLKVHPMNDAPPERLSLIQILTRQFQILESTWQEILQRKRHFSTRRGAETRPFPVCLLSMCAYRRQQLFSHPDPVSIAG